MLLYLFEGLDHHKNQIRVNLFSIFNKYWHTSFGIRWSLLDMLITYISFNTINKDERYKIIEMIKKYLRTADHCSTGIMMRALEKLGALVKESNTEIIRIRLDIQRILENPLDKNNRIEANIIWLRQFDHPYRTAYSEAFDELTSENQKALLIMASFECDINSTWTPFLLSMLISFRDPSILSTIVRFTCLPSHAFTQDSRIQFFRQDDLKRFIIAHMSLGIFNGLLPPLEGDTLINREEILTAIGRIFYWCNRSNLSIEIKKRECFPEIQKLLNHPDVSVAILAEIDHFRPNLFHEFFSSYDLSEYIYKPISTYFPDLLCQICRKFLTNPANCEDYFIPPWPDSHKFAIVSLASFGDILDIKILKKWQNDINYGTYAINAIKNINKKNFG